MLCLMLESHPYTKVSLNISRHVSDPAQAGKFSFLYIKQERLTVTTIFPLTFIIKFFIQNLKYPKLKAQKNAKTLEDIDVLFDFRPG